MKSAYRMILPLVLAAAALAMASQVLAEAMPRAALMQVQGLVFSP